MTPYLLFGILIIASIIGYLPGLSERLIRKSGIAAAACSFLTAAFLAVPSLARVHVWHHELWRLDGFAAVMLLLVCFLHLTATVVSHRYIGTEYREGLIDQRHIRFYYGSLALFVLSMAVTVLSNHMAVLWMGLEATTLSTAFLVAFYKKEGAVEAAWKYLLICSTGITLGLIGIVAAGYAANQAGIPADQAFFFTALRDAAARLPDDVFRWAFVFLFVGFGAKVGFVPMHTWLPDAHSKTPSPISALLSGILLNVALFSIIRFKSVTDAVLGSSDFTERFFLVFGLLSVVFAALLIFIQKNYKRLLAYSSVEHMGLASWAIGLGPAGMLPALMHMIGHSFFKSALFFSAGEILLHWKTTKIDHVYHFMKERPITAMCWLLGVVFIVAVPPSALFFSEFFMVGYGIGRHPYITGILLVALTIVCAAMLRLTFDMLFGKREPSHESSEPIKKKKETINVSHVVILTHLILGVGLGLYLISPSGTILLSNIATQLK